VSRIDQVPTPPGAGLDPGRRVRRQGASLSLRGGDAEAPTMESLMDPATKSLGEALKITFRLLQLAIVVLVGLYVLSGGQTVNEAERGVRVVLGRVASSDLAPGFHLSWPEPIGELVKVQTGEQRRELTREFWPSMTESEETAIAGKEGVQSLASGGRDSLDPDADGHLLTADGNVAHARWTVTYRRRESDAAINLRNINPEFEDQIVAAMVRRAIVKAAASVTIDELLKNTPDASIRKPGARTVETIARDAAQEALDKVEAGIQIQQLTLNQRIPPRPVMTAFNQVQSAQSDASKSIEDARQQAQNTLLNVAGQGAEPILRAIDAYETALAAGDDAASRARLAEIDALLQNQTVAIGSEQVVPNTFGQVSRTVAEAREYRTTLVSRTKSEVSAFLAKREAFKANPLVMIEADWRGALTEFLRRDTVQEWVLPPADQMKGFVLMLNRDPAIAREQEQKRNESEAKKAEEARQLRQQQEWSRERFDANRTTEAQQ
jgi:modulator of FtsH protease HflK